MLTGECPDGYHPFVRRRTRQIQIGPVAVGGDAPVSIQTMAKADPADLDTIVAQLVAARRAGCDIARIAVPDQRACQTIVEIKERSGLPIVADIHFDYRLAVMAAREGADALRINPGNLGGPDALAAVVEAAGEAEIPIRVGVNAGSLPKSGGLPADQTADNMVTAAVESVDAVREMGFENIKVSLKAFDVQTMVEANRRFARRLDYPLHLGVTEAGPPLSGAVRSAAALSLLLSEGIGDTVRVSLSAEPLLEVRAARHLLRALGLRRGGVVVSCPTCGRTGADVATLAERVSDSIEQMDLDLTVAIMGCEVNGPGEARAADLGVAFGPRGEGLLFEHGRVMGKHPNPRLEDALMDRLSELGKEIEHGE
jgi:(E)-4-hydroxy-3-methylbut-2-enyl-diphosphate synthase